jgi:hypothetical protein
VHGVFLGFVRRTPAYIARGVPTLYTVGKKLRRASVQAALERLGRGWQSWHATCRDPPIIQNLGQFRPKS